MTTEVSGLHHLLIRVQDPERARRFYEQTLGFSFIELPVDAAFVAEWKDHPTEGVLLATPLGNTSLILAPSLEGTPDDDRFSERRIGVDVPTAGIETDPVLGKPYVAFRDPENVQWEFYLAT
jgi:catechol 2,3-dioxygenase-like lactoylglutathione lyase family enzyme